MGDYGNNYFEFDAGPQALITHTLEEYLVR